MVLGIKSVARGDHLPCWIGFGQPCGQPCCRQAVGECKWGSFTLQDNRSHICNALSLNNVVSEAGQVGEIMFRLDMYIPLAAEESRIQLVIQLELELMAGRRPMQQFAKYLGVLAGRAHTTADAQALVAIRHAICDLPSAAKRAFLLVWRIVEAQSVQKTARYSECVDKSPTRPTSTRLDFCPWSGPSLELSDFSGFMGTCN